MCVGWVGGEREGEIVLVSSVLVYNPYIVRHRSGVELGADRGRREEGGRISHW